MKRFACLIILLMLASSAWAELKWDPILGALRQSDSTTSISVSTTGTQTVIGNMSVGTNLTVGGIIYGTSTNATTLNGVSAYLPIEGTAGLLNSTIYFAEGPMIVSYWALYGHGGGPNFQVNDDQDITIGVPIVPVSATYPDIGGASALQMGNVRGTNFVENGTRLVNKYAPKIMIEAFSLDGVVVATNDINYSIARKVNPGWDMIITNVNGQSTSGTGVWYFVQCPAGTAFNTAWATSVVATAANTGINTIATWTWTNGNWGYFFVDGATCNSYPTNTFLMDIVGFYINTTVAP